MSGVSVAERRRFFAEEIEAVAHLEAPALVEAFARVPREAFLGSGPWQISRVIEPGYRTTISDDPKHVYHDVAIAIDPARRLHNGQPSSLARWIAALELRPGERVLHIGSGTGYYTAIIADTVGETGSVIAYEVDPELAARARANLAAWRHVTVETGDASAPVGPFDAIFVNAGCTYARSEWLAATQRIVLPLTIHVPQYPLGVGGMLRADRTSDGWAARVVSQAAIYDCSNARDPAHEALLRPLLAPGVKIQAIETAPHEKTAACLAHIEGFCLR